MNIAPANENADADRSQDMRNGRSGRPMSIKDRIRAMNLVAERSTSNLKPVGSSTPRVKSSEFLSTADDDGNGCNMTFDGTACDLSTLNKNNNRQKPKGLSSDPGVGSDQKTAAVAINMWRRRRVEEHKAESLDVTTSGDDTNDETAEWTIFDLTKGGRKDPSSPGPSSGNDIHVEKNEVTSEPSQADPVREVSTIKLKSVVPIENRNNTQKIIRTGRASPISMPVSSSRQNGKSSPRSSPRSMPVSTSRQNGKSSPRSSPRSMPVSTARQNDYGFVMAKLKPVRRAPHTLALVTAAMSSPVRNVVEEIQDHPKENIPLATQAVEQDHVGKIAFPTSPKQRGPISIGTAHLKRVSPVSNAAQNDKRVSVVSKAAAAQNDKRVGAVSNAAQNDMGSSMKKFAPQRSKMSDRIKAFSSAANGTTWKQQSPARYPVAPPANLNSANMKRHSNEDSSCASSERQSNDDDSISVSSPIANGTPARLGAQPPTPNSYNSEAAYASIASSGDGAVAGSVGSSQQTQSNQMRYAHVGTPGSSVQDDSSVASPKRVQVLVTKSVVKNTLQSKLENDKQRAARRSKMVRKQMKVPSVLVAAQKKAQDQDTKPLWGSNINQLTTPSRRAPKEVAQLTNTPRSLDADPTLLEQSEVGPLTNTPKSLDADPTLLERSDAGLADKSLISSRNTAGSIDDVDSMQAMNGCHASTQVKSEDNLMQDVNGCQASTQVKSEDNDGGRKGQTKADVMKLIIKRRRRRKEYQAGKKDGSKDQESVAPPEGNKEQPMISVSSLPPKKIARSHSPIIDATADNPDVLVNIKTKKPLEESDLKLKEEPAKKMSRSYSSLAGTSVDKRRELINSKEKVPTVEDSAGVSASAKANPVVKPRPVVARSKAEEPAVEKANNSPPSPVPLESDKVPPLPPNIIRSTQPRLEKTGPMAEETRKISFPPKSSTRIASGQSTPASPSSSISVASSVLFDDYPHDEDEPEPVVYLDDEDEPEPFVYPDDEDEPEPVVDSFIDMDLSPIRSNDISKHVFDTSASYGGSPDRSLNRPGHIRDLIESQQSTPKRANRHVSLRNVGEMLYSPAGTLLDCFTTRSSATSPASKADSAPPTMPFDQRLISSKMSSASSDIQTVRPRLEMLDIDVFGDNPPFKDSMSTFRNHSSDAFSDVSSGFRSASTTSGTSSAVSAMASRANKVLAERRGRSKRKLESGISESGISVDQTHATDLARKIMSGGSGVDKESPAESLRKVVRGKEAIKEALLGNRAAAWTRANYLDLNEPEKDTNTPQIETLDQTTQNAPHVSEMDQTRATDLARKIMNGGSGAEKESPAKSSRTVVRDKIALLGNRTDVRTGANYLDLNEPDKDTNTPQIETLDQKTQQVPTPQGETLDQKTQNPSHFIERVPCVTPVSHKHNRNESQTSDISFEPCVTPVGHTHNRNESSQSSDISFDANLQHSRDGSHSSDLAMDVSNIQHDSRSDLAMDVSNIDNDTSAEYGTYFGSNAGCIYPLISTCQIDKFSESQGFKMMCGDLDNLHTSDSLSLLDISTLSAVRISQQDDEDIPFDEEAAIEVEYIPTENIGTASKEFASNNSLLMRISSNSMNKSGTHFSVSPNVSIMSSSPNYVSSCDNTDESDNPTIQSVGITNGRRLEIG